MSFWDDLTGKTAANASNAAAADTFAKQSAATGALRTAGNNYAIDVSGLAGNYDQYRGAGSDALTRLMAGLGLGGGGADFTNAVHATPGYSEGLNTGTQAALRAANATGMGASGGTLKALQRYGSDYESTKTGDYLTRLMGVAGTGLTATGAATNLGAEGARGRLGAETSAYGGDMTAAGTIGQGQVAGAQAQQQGTQGLLNAGSNVLGSLLGGGGASSYLGGLAKKAGGSLFGGLSNGFMGSGSFNGR